MQQNDGSCKKEKDGRFGLYISLAEYSIYVYAVFSICEQTIILHQGDVYGCQLITLLVVPLHGVHVGKTDRSGNY